MTAFREVLPKLSTVSKAKARSATLWGQLKVEKHLFLEGARGRNYITPSFLLRSYLSSKSIS